MLGLGRTVAFEFPMRCVNRAAPAVRVAGVPDLEGVRAETGAARGLRARPARAGGSALRKRADRLQIGRASCRERV